MNAEKIFGTVERIKGSVIEQTEMDIADYQASVDACAARRRRLSAVESKSHPWMLSEAERTLEK